MLKVYLLRGLPGSGKSSWAKKMIDEHPNSYKRVNKDDLRSMLDNSKFSKDAEKFILKVRDLIILEAIEHGKHVIVDDCNLATKHFDRIKLLVHGKAEVIIQDFTDVPIEDCISRDLKRNASVGEKKIREMHNQFLKKNDVYIEDTGLPKAILVDVDGTLAIMSKRSPFDWEKVKEDKINEAVKKLVNSYDHYVIIMSGRDSVCRQQTHEWLIENGISFNELFMRPEGNNEKDAIIKRRLFEENIRGKYFIDFVVDDRLSVSRMWHSMGLQLFRVGDPDADF